MQNTQQLVINWHLTEACNYSCQYCYAAWNKATNPRELINDAGQTLELLTELYRFFEPNNTSNSLKSNFNWSSVRLNFAGGEPLLHAKKLPLIVKQARELGFEVSMISNGSYLNENLLNLLASELTWLGISIDSDSAVANQIIGRRDRHKRLLDFNALSESLIKARLNNPNLRLKLNTVINQANHEEDLSALIELFSPEKWKVLRMLPVVNKKLAINDEQFAQFVNRHEEFSQIMSVEDNQDMRESYLMVDPYGRFFQNSQLIAGPGYTYSQPILTTGAQAAFSEMSFDHNLFDARYVPALKGGLRT